MQRSCSQTLSALPFSYIIRLIAETEQLGFASGGAALVEYEPEKKLFWPTRQKHDHDYVYTNKAGANVKLAQLSLTSGLYLHSKSAGLDTRSIFLLE